MNMPILRNHDQSSVAGYIDYVDGVLTVKFLPWATVTIDEFFEIFGGAGARITEWHGERIVKAEILEFSIP